MTFKYEFQVLIELKYHFLIFNYGILKFENRNLVFQDLNFEFGRRIGRFRSIFFRIWNFCRGFSLKFLGVADQQFRVERFRRC